MNSTPRETILVDNGIHKAGPTPGCRQLVFKSINFTKVGRDCQPAIGRIKTKLGWENFASS